MIKHSLAAFGLLFAALIATGNHTSPALQRFTFTEPHMGTLFKIVLYAPDEATAKKAAKAAFDRIAELNRIMSDYLASSELMQLCKKAGGDPVPVSADLFEIISKSVEFAEKTEGALDITVGPVVKLWRKARRTREMPAAEDLAKAVKLVGYKNIKLDAKNRTIQLLVAGMMLDLGAIAKGYAAQAALEVLQRLGIRRALVAAGGDIAVGDAPPDAKGWKIGIAPLKNPEAPPTHHLLLVNAAVSTAGDSEQFVEIGGKRYSHIVDPKTGMGLVGRRSVTVIAKNGTTADALDTALCVMGPERGMKLIESLKDVAALYVMETDKGIVTIPSKGFEKFRWVDK
jgi:thiamine biosynthesis lipoprotein